MRQLPTVVFLATCLLATAAQAQTETLFVKRASALRQGPTDASPVVVALAAQTAVTRLPERQGPWMRVKTEATQSGWIHMFDVATLAAPSTLGSTASGALRGLTNFFNRGSSSGTTTATSTVGIRGLGAEDIANAQPNLQALQQVEALRSDAAQARRFAADAQLLARAVEPLPAPANPGAAEGNAMRGGAQ
jgi:Bacterial SH3 domain